MKSIIIILVIAWSFVLASGCSKEEVVDQPISEVKKQISCFPNLVVDSLSLDVALDELKTSTAAQTAFESWITSVAQDAMTSEPYSVQEIKPEDQDKSKVSAQNIYSIAVSWLFMDKEKTKASLYLQRATTFIKAWASTNEPSSHTPRESILLPVYEAYSIIRLHINDSDRKEIDSWIRKRADYYKKLDLTGNLLENNWNTVRINLLFYYAQILNDEMLYNYSVFMLKNHIELNILENGVSHDFVNRDAFAYHAYNMLYYARILKAVAMSKGNKAAFELYRLKNKKGSSIESCVQFWEPYIMDPANNVHLEFVNTQWAPDKERSDYNKPYNPGGTVYVLDELRYIESKCASYIEKITGSNKHERTFNYWINSISVVSE